MLESVVTSSNLAMVAKRLEGDLRSRGLQQGDRYLTVADAALMLGVSNATAHRAMSILVRKKLLIRQHGRGTFVGEGIGQKRAARVRTVYILMPEADRDVSSIQLEDMMDSLRARLGGVNVQFCFIPSSNSVDYVRELIGSAQRIGQFAGAVPISCPRAVYKYLEEIGGPMVVLGSLYADQRSLASVDVDYRQIGQSVLSNQSGRVFGPVSQLDRKRAVRQLRAQRTRTGGHNGSDGARTPVHQERSRHPLSSKGR